MNAYFENANTRLNNSSKAKEIHAHQFGDSLISFICAIIGIITCPAAIAIEKTAAVFALFVLSVFVIGAVESASLPMFFGIAICGIVSLFEYALLKSMFARAKKTNKNKEENA